MSKIWNLFLPLVAIFIFVAQTGCQTENDKEKEVLEKIEQRQKQAQEERESAQKSWIQNSENQDKSVCGKVGCRVENFDGFVKDYNVLLEMINQKNKFSIEELKQKNSVLRKYIYYFKPDIEKGSYVKKYKEHYDSPYKKLSKEQQNKFDSLNDKITSITQSLKKGERPMSEAEKEGKKMLAEICESWAKVKIRCATIDPGPFDANYKSCVGQMSKEYGISPGYAERKCK